MISARQANHRKKACKKSKLAKVDVSLKFHFDGKYHKAKIILFKTNSDLMHEPIEDVDDVFVIENS